MKVLLVFVDGLGIGRDDRAVNPLISAEIPLLRGLMPGTIAASGPFSVYGREPVALSLDATLGFPGLPQSATGQTALLTGLNAAAAAGGHVNGRPTAKLKALLEGHSVYKRLLAAGKSVTFINAYRDESFEMMRDGTYPASASTVAALGAGLRLRTVQDVVEGRAVYHDITSRSLVERGYPVTEIHPRTAGAIAASIAGCHDLSVFEFFLTDMAGHRRDMNLARRVLERLDAFMGGVLENAFRTGTEEMCVVLTSDHGNVEDLSTPDHTRNPVPAVFVGVPAEMRPRLSRMESITDVSAAIVEIVCKGR
ncbi:MAG: hypothetical protein NUV93_02690 [Firmicutes bacterium]|jgi:hypothetical protein|nr:hypothetical protein [Bacillota bacterium]